MFGAMMVAALLMGASGPEVATRTSTASGFWAAMESMVGPDGPVRLSGFIQFDYQRLQRSVDQLSDSDGQPLNEDRFLIRRGRLRLAADWRYLGVIAELEVSTSDGAPLGARELVGYLQYPGEEGPLLRLVAGLFPIPFGFEMAIQTNTERFFGERTLVSRAFLPGRFDVGVGLLGQYRWLRFALAVQNGEPIAGRAFPDADPNAGKDFAGRFGVDLDLGSWGHLSGGVSGLRGTGFSPGNPPTKDTFIWRDFNEDGVVSGSELQSVQGSAATPSENFGRWGFGADLQLAVRLPVVGPLTISAEAALGVNLDRSVAPADPRLLGADQRSRGFYVQLVQSLFERATLGVRYDLYEPFVDSTDVQGGRTVKSRRAFQTWTFAAGGNYRFTPNVRARVLLEYELQRNSLGRDEAGLPAPLANDTIRARLELMF